MTNDFHANVSFETFFGKLKKALSTPLKKSEYKVLVADALKAFLRTYCLGKKVNHQVILDSWLSDVDDGFTNEEKIIVCSFTENSVKDYNKGEGRFTRAVAVHYRLQARQDLYQREHVAILDEFVFKADAKDLLGTFFTRKRRIDQGDDGSNFAPQFAHLRDILWSPIKENPPLKEISLELFCGQASKTFGARLFVYGLREIWLHVSTSGCDVFECYRGGENGLPRHVHFKCDNRWRITVAEAPKDHLGFLDGSLMRSGLCSTKPGQTTGNSISVRAITPKTAFKLEELDALTGEKIETEKNEKRELIFTLFTVHIGALAKMDDEMLILSEAKNSP